MITTINEFFFSKHYAYDSDNRFNLRIRNAIIKNKLQNLELAKTRFKKAMYYYALEILDKTSIAVSPTAIAFGNLYFRENNRLIQAEIEVDKSIGNIYVAVIKDQTVVTLLLYPFTYSNQDIVDKIKAHDGSEIKDLRDIDLNSLSLSDRKRKNIIIDLDLSDIEFNKQFPAITLKNNSIDKILTKQEIEKNEQDKLSTPKEAIYSPTAIPKEYSTLVPNKEYVIYDGMEVLIQYPEGPKIKKIRKLIIDETGSSRKFSLEFQNTAKPYPLEIGKNFIISPKISNEEYRKLIDAFNLDDDKEFHFQGPILKFNFYSKQKTGSIPKLGIIIEPKIFF